MQYKRNNNRKSASATAQVCNNRYQQTCIAYMYVGMDVTKYGYHLPTFHIQHSHTTQRRPQDFFLGGQDMPVPRGGVFEHTASVKNIRP